MTKKLIAFNWKDFYSKDNAKILEDFLDRQVVEFGEIVNSLFPYTLEEQKRKFTHRAVFDLFNKQFSEWLGEIFNALPASFICILMPDSIEMLGFKLLSRLPSRMPFNPFPSVIKSSEDFYCAIRKHTKVFADPVLAILISNEYLPDEIRRLARMTPEKFGGEFNENCYQELDNLSNDEVVGSPMNFSDKMPRLLTFEEVKRNTEKFKAVDDIFKAMLANRIGTYIKIESQYVVGSGIRFARRGYPSLYRIGNCGNPFYLKRYNSLERLSVEQVKKIWVNGYVKLGSHHFQNAVQSTDIETKFHIERTLKSFGDKMKIEISDLFFLEEEINDYETAPKIALKPVKNIFKKGYMEPWAVESRRLADEVALEMWNSGMQEITARNISDKVASRLGENRGYWGTRGPRSGGNIRNIALIGWHFIPPQSRAS